MDQFAQKHFNVSWSVLKKLLCNQTDLNATELLNECNEAEKYSRTAFAAEDIGVGLQKWKLLTFVTVIFVLGMVLNICLVTIILTNKRFRKQSWTYVSNLAIADILVLLAMLGYVFYLLYIPKWPINVHKYLFSSLDIFLSSASMLAVASIALDRVFAVSWWKHGTFSNKSRKSRCIIIGIWSYSILIFCLASCRMFIRYSSFFNSFVFWMASVVAVFGSIVTTIICYSIIAVCYCRYAMSYNRSSRPSVVASVSIDETWMVKSNSEDIQIRKHIIKRAFDSAIFPLPFVLCWSFYLGIQIYEVVSGTFLDNAHLNIAMLVIPWTVSALNPLIYICFTKSIRKEMKNVLWKIFDRKGRESCTEKMTKLSVTI